MTDERLVLWQERPCLRCAKWIGRHQNFCVRRLPTEKCCRCATLGVKCDPIPETQLDSFHLVQSIFRLGVTPDALRAGSDWIRAVEGAIRKDPSLLPSQSRTRSLGSSESDRIAVLEARLDRMEGTMGQILQILNQQVSALLLLTSFPMETPYRIVLMIVERIFWHSSCRCPRCSPRCPPPWRYFVESPGPVSSFGTVDIFGGWSFL